MPEDYYCYPKQYKDKILIPVKKEDKHGIVNLNNNMVHDKSCPRYSFIYSNYPTVKKKRYLEHGVTYFGK